MLSVFCSGVCCLFFLQASNTPHDHEICCQHQQADLHKDLIMNAAEMELRATRDIAAGEQLTISYLDANMGAQARQRHLQWAYGFLCQCRRCSEELGIG